MTIDLTWDNEDDYDMHVYDSTDSELGSSVGSFGTHGESVTLTGQQNCLDIRVEIQNWLAPPTIDMHLKTSIKNLKPSL